MLPAARQRAPGWLARVSIVELWPLLAPQPMARLEVFAQKRWPAEQGSQQRQLLPERRGTCDKKGSLSVRSFWPQPILTRTAHSAGRSCASALLAFAQPHYDAGHRKNGRENTGQEHNRGPKLPTMGTLMDPSRAYPDHVSAVELTLVYHNLLRQ